MKDAEKLIKLLEKVSGKKVKLKEDTLPSNKQIGDIVNLDFGSAGELSGCRIKDVRFAEDKVYYDIEVPIVKEGDDVQEATVIKDIDSVIVNEEVSEEKPLKENLSVEQKERMEGIAPKRYLNNTKIFLRLLTSEWLGEGFEKEDIKEYINELIDNI